MERINLNKVDYKNDKSYQWCDWGEEIDLKVYDQGNWVSFESFFKGRI